MKKNEIHSITNQDTVKKLPKMTMPVYWAAPQRNKAIGVHINASKSGDLRYDPVPNRNLSSVSEEIQIFPELQFEPVTEPLAERKELKNKHYILPTREEYEILKTLWLKEDVMDTTIYTCVDTSLNLTMSMLNQILDKMSKKKLVTRQLVTPRLEFNAFGVPIEMSPTNLRNRVYVYHSSVDQTKLKHFINAAAYEVGQDSSWLKKRKFKAAKQDKDLLNELNEKSLIE
ncbi:hypothetical protein ACFL4L_04450 [bacterium]